MFCRFHEVADTNAVCLLCFLALTKPRIQMPPVYDVFIQPSNCKYALLTPW